FSKNDDKGKQNIHNQKDRKKIVNDNFHGFTSSSTNLRIPKLFFKVKGKKPLPSILLANKKRKLERNCPTFSFYLYCGIRISRNVS
ncbi:TPA: hypothetical protein ACHAD0_002084, partial [Enterococcus faecium]